MSNPDGADKAKAIWDDPPSSGLMKSLIPAPAASGHGKTATKKTARSKAPAAEAPPPKPAANTPSTLLWGKPAQIPEYEERLHTYAAQLQATVSASEEQAPEIDDFEDQV